MGTHPIFESDFDCLTVLYFVWKSVMIRISGLIFPLFLVCVYEICKIAPDPLIDEVFHIPAANRYCQGNYSYWDDKITTPPGLYIYSSLILRIINWFHNVECDVPALRATNTLLLPIYFLILDSLHRFLYGPSPKVRNFSLLLFSMFYYTDNGSIVSVLLYLLFQIFEAHLASIAVGLVSLCFRQTNIIWLFFSSSIAILYQESDLGDYIRGLDKMILNLSIQPYCRYFWDSVCSIGVYLAIGLCDKNRIGFIIRSTFGFIVNGIVFICFIYWNNGDIVLGDRNAHQPCFHLLQVCYFGLFNLIFAWPILLSNLKDFIRFLLDHKWKFI